MNSDFYKKFFEKTPKEEEIEKKIEQLEADYRNSAFHKEYVEKENALYNDLAEERRKKNLEIGPHPKRDRGVKKILNKKKDFNIKEHTDADRVLEEYQKLSKEDKRNFDIGLAALKPENLEPYSNPVTTKDQLSELQDILVQVCINYININGLTDIDEITFTADSLQHSAHFGKWVPATDSYIRAVGYEEVDDGKINYYVRKKIGDIW